MMMQGKERDEGRQRRGLEMIQGEWKYEERKKKSKEKKGSKRKGDQDK